MSLTALWPCSAQNEKLMSPRAFQQATMTWTARRVVASGS